jgi:hypothetical protein
VAHSDLVHAYVSQLLCEWFSLGQVRRDEDGDYPFRYGTAVYYVRVLDRDPAVLRIFAIAVHDLDCSPGLLEELNEINANVAFARVSHGSRQVWVEAELWADNLDAFVLGMTCERVGELADRIGPSLATLFGGLTRFELDDPEGPEPQQP